MGTYSYTIGLSGIICIKDKKKYFEGLISEVGVFLQNIGLRLFLILSFLDGRYQASSESGFFGRVGSGFSIKPELSVQYIFLWTQAKLLKTTVRIELAKKTGS